MKVSLNWLNEFVDLKGIDIKEIVSKFSLATAEVEGYEAKGDGIKGVVVGEIKTCERHPSSNKPLFVLTVDQGDKVVPVVCGAPNCRVGLKVAFAKVGSQLGEINVGVARLAGAESQGMCLSGRELGISADHDGIIELEGAPKNGEDIKKILPVDDVVFEIDNKSLTNRPDLWGHLGIARELSVIFNRPLKGADKYNGRAAVECGNRIAKYKDLPKIPVAIENKKDCYSYGAVRVDNITRGKSPLFMQIRLFYCGINAHGFLVDLTNFIMLECGQPCHAFDAGKIGKISVGNQSGGKFVTLKDQEITITSEMLFIKSDGEPVALAGVMGGKNSEIEDGTKDCVFEFATFDAACVRKTASAIGVRTDASNRYEKSLDVSLNVVACERALEFIEKFDAGAKVVSCFNHVVAVDQKPIFVSVKKDYLERFCGVLFDYKAVERNLAGLGFSPVITNDEIRANVPSWRATKDISCSADLIEEIVRTYGYANIMPVAPRVKVMPVERGGLSKLVNRIKDLLCDKYAFDEVHTYIWNDTKLNKQLNIETPSHLRVVNSCVKDDDAIRSAMIPSLIGVVARNRKLGAMRVFEIGKVCCGVCEGGGKGSASKSVVSDSSEQDKALSGFAGRAVESQVLGLCLASKTESADILYKKVSDVVRDVFDLCGFKVKFQLGGMGADAEYIYNAPLISPHLRRGDNYLHPKNNAALMIGGKVVGGIGIVHPMTSTAIDPKINLAAAAVHLDWLDGLREARDSKVLVSKYQKNTLDFTFVTDKVYGDVESVFDAFKHPLFMGYGLKDVYGGEQQGDPVSYTLTFIVGSFERTLTAADIDDVHKAIIAHGKSGGFVIKG